MHSLYDVLLKQHGRQLVPVRCAYSTIVQLHRYFEEVVLENNLSALVTESLPLAAKRSAREKARIRERVEKPLRSEPEMEKLNHLPRAAARDENAGRCWTLAPESG